MKKDDEIYFVTRMMERHTLFLMSLRKTGELPAIEIMDQRILEANKATIFIEKMEEQNHSLQHVIEKAEKYIRSIKTVGSVQ